MSAGIKNHNRDKYDRVRRLMWIKCEACGRLVFFKDYKNNLRLPIKFEVPIKNTTQRIVIKTSN